MLTNLYFIRHAHSKYTPDELYRPLSEQGQRDAERITQLLEKENIVTGKSWDAQDLDIHVSGDKRGWEVPPELSIFNWDDIMNIMMSMGYAAITDVEFEYLMGCRYKNEFTSDMEKIVLPKSMWAVFPNVIDAWKRLYTEWLPTEGYELADLPCIENYLAPDRVPNSELWVPLIPK